MADTAFDTHREFRRLRDAGFEDIKAEAIIHSMNEAVMGGVATKADLDSLEARMDAKIARMDVKIARMDVKIERSASTIIKWVIGSNIAFLALVATIVGIAARFF